MSERKQNVHIISKHINRDLRTSTQYLKAIFNSFILFYIEIIGILDNLNRQNMFYRQYSNLKIKRPL